jgi:hypothetical protein
VGDAVSGALGDREMDLKRTPNVLYRCTISCAEGPGASTDRLRSIDGPWQSQPLRATRLLASLLLLLLPAAVPAGATALAPDAHPPEFVSPLDGARYVSPRTTLIVRPGGVLAPGVSPDPGLFTVVGSESGVHSGQLRLSDHRDAVLFIPDAPFAAGETVTYRVNTGLRTADGATTGPVAGTFHVSPGSDAGFPDARAALGVDGTDAAGAAGALSTTSSTDSPVLVTTVSGPTAPGRLFLSDLNFFYPGYSSHLYILGNDGMPCFQRDLEGWGLDFDVQPGGDLTYFDEAGGNYMAMDSTYAVVDSFRADGYTTDLHELRRLPDGHVLLLADDPETVNMSQIVPGGSPAAKVLGVILQELDTNKNVVFEWRSWDHYQITDATDWGPPPLIDYVHANSIAIDTDGTLLLSCRHMDEITKISRRTGAIIWRLGGKHNQFQFIGDPIGFSHQHDVRILPTGDMTVFDNGNGHVPRFSRALEYRLDQRRKTATLVWQFRHSPDVYSGAMGDVERLPNGNTLIGWGFANPAVTEVTPDGQVVYEAYFTAPDKILRYSYRAFRYDWPPHPAPPDHQAVVTLSPKVLNFERPAAWIVARIEPEGFRPEQIKVSSVRLAGVIPADPRFAIAGSSGAEGRPTLEVRFSRGEASRYLAPGWNRLEVRGQLGGGETFAGSDDVRVIGAPQNSLAARVSPNPLNPTGVLSFATTREGPVTVGLYDVQGRLVKTLLDRFRLGPGSHQVRFDMTGARGGALASGIYFYRIDAPDGRSEGRVTVLK